MATIIRANGTTETLSPQNGATFTLEEMQAVVGGYIEHIGLADVAFGGTDMWLNEEGKLNGMPFNAKATDLLRAAGGMAGDYIVGDVLICNANADGEATP